MLDRSGSDGSRLEVPSGQRVITIRAYPSTLSTRRDRTMKGRLALATLAFFVSAIIAPPISAAPAAAPPSTLSLPVTGTGSGATFTGVFQLQRFATENGAVVASGLLTGTVTTATGATSVARSITLPVVVGETTCDILHLDLGPLAIDLLGLQIDLSRIVLDITAQAGAGNLLGNLLCAVANLLNDPGGLARLLNQILAALLG
jgi:hypothetical protein